MDALRADDIIDRQRLRRKLTRWRILAFSGALIAIGILAFNMAGDDRFSAKSVPHIAKLVISGTITEDAKLLDTIADIGKNDNVRGVIINVDSPGGTTTGGEAVYDALLKLSDDKLVVTQVGTLAASAGYMVAAATDHIVARKTSIVGSIGVLFQYPNFEGLLTSWGIDVRAIKSSPLKAEPSFFGETPDGAEDMIRAMILDSFDWFKEIVAERREFSTAEINRLADGSVFTGRQALENGLIDRLGGESAAKDWLIENDVDADLAIVEWKIPTETPSGLLFGQAFDWFARAAGLPIAPLLATNEVADRLFLDGLLSVWHVSGE